MDFRKITTFPSIVHNDTFASYQESPMISPRRLYYLLEFATPPIVIFIVGLLAACVSFWFGLGILLMVFVLSAVIERIKCPNCGHPIGWGEYRLIGLHFWWWRNLIKRHCVKCQYDLSIPQPFRVIFRRQEPQDKNNPSGTRT